MISAEVILDKRVKSKKGFPVKIRVYCSKNKIHRSAGSIGVYQKRPELSLSNEIKRRQLDLIEEVNYCNDNLLTLDESINVIKNGVPIDDIDTEIQLLEKRLEILRQKKGKINGIGIIEFGNKFIEEKRLNNESVQLYTSTLNIFKRFLAPKEDLNLNNLTREVLLEFIGYNKKNKVSDASISAYLAKIKSIYKESQLRESLGIKKDNPFIKIKESFSNKVEYNITAKDLKKLITLDCDLIQDRYRAKYKKNTDIILFQFAIGGHDLIDVANLKWKNIKKGRIEFKRYKLRYKPQGGSLISNKLSDFALSIIEKYGDKESERIFSFIPCPEKNESKYKIYLNILNRVYLPKISKLAELPETLKTKATRYIFRTISGNLMIDSYIIMLLQGHTPQGMTFGYMGHLNYEVQDREHQKILDTVFK